MDIEEQERVERKTKREKERERGTDTVCMQETNCPINVENLSKAQLRRRGIQVLLSRNPVMGHSEYMRVKRTIGAKMFYWKHMRVLNYLSRHSGKI